MKKLILLLSLLSILCACSEDKKGNDSSSVSAAIYEFVITCSSPVNCNDNSADRATVSVAWTTDSCTDIGSSTTFNSIGTSTVSCAGGTCTATVNSYSPANLPEGDYTVVVSIDTDGDTNPESGEPYQCDYPFSIRTDLAGDSMNYTLNNDL